MVVHEQSQTDRRPVRTAVTLAIVLVTLAGFGAAVAQSPDPATIIRNQDRDGDGQLSAEEFKGGAEKFARIDSDSDGFLTEEEFAAAQAGGGPNNGKQETQSKTGTPTAIIAKQDQDGDGQLSAAEFKGGAEKFTRIDADGDGFITLGELAAAQARQSSGQGGSNGKGGGGGGKSCTEIKDACHIQCSAQNPYSKARLSCWGGCDSRWQDCLASGQSCRPNGRCVPATPQ